MEPDYGITAVVTTHLFRYTAHERYSSFHKFRELVIDMTRQTMGIDFQGRIDRVDRYVVLHVHSEGAEKLTKIRIIDEILSPFIPLCYNYL